MELQEYFFILRKRILLITLITLVATVSSAVLSYFVIKPTYKSDISVIIGKNSSGDALKSQDINYNDLMMYQQMVKTYSVFAKSRKVAEDVIDKLNLNMSTDTLLSMITVSPEANTEFLDISVKSKDPQQAMAIANQVAKSLKEVSADVYSVDNVKLLDDAQLPVNPDSPKPKLNMAIAFFIGLMVSVGLVFLLEYMDNTIKTQEDVEKLLGLPVIGTIPFVDDKE